MQRRIGARLAAPLARGHDLRQNGAVSNAHLPASEPLLELGRLCRAGIEGRRERSSLAEDTFRTLARRHRIEGLLAAATGDQAVQQRVTAESLSQAAEYARIREALADLDPFFLKGLSVAAQFYARPFLKQSADIDLLVAPCRLGEASARLETLGYWLVTPRVSARLDRWARFSNQSVWQSPSHTVELHHRATLVPFAGTGSPMKVTIAPGVAVATFSPADQYAYLAFHGAFSGWFRLKWLADFSALALRSGLPLADLHAHAKAMGAGRASAQALLLAEALFGLDLDDELRTQVDRDTFAWRLARWALRLLEGGEPTERRFGTLPLHASFALLQPGAAPILRRLRDLAGQRLFR